MTAKRKLIEAALPLDAINAACKADKDRKTGTIRNLHKWFAPMPLPAWRALLFTTLVDDSEDESERDRLMRLVERLVESGGDLPPADVLVAARAEIERCWPDGVPPVLDPFCGGGSTLVEAQRLGCPTFGSDLNPVPALITQVLTDLVPAVACEAPVYKRHGQLAVAGGPHDALIGDVLHCASVVSERVRQAIAPWYPSANDAFASTVVWLWTRVARCSNPVCGARTPLLTSWDISKGGGKRRWLEPVIADHDVTFTVKGPPGSPPEPLKTGRGASFLCAKCGSLLDEKYIAKEGLAGRLDLQMTAVVESSGRQDREYRAPTREEHAAGLIEHAEVDGLDVPLAEDPRNIWCTRYGLTEQSHLYTPRQRSMLATFAREVAEVAEQVRRDGGSERRAQAIASLLALCVGKMAQAHSSLVRWNVRSSASAKAEPAFGRHDMPMTWDFAECNPFGRSVGDWDQVVTTTLRALAFVPTGVGTVRQHDARTVAKAMPHRVVVATDPPYFDQITYADLSDYFYVWHRMVLRKTFPELYATRATPKSEELIALVGRHEGSRQLAQRYFVDGFTQTFQSLSEVQATDAPMLVVYAFKEQSSRVGDHGVAPGWVAILEALVAADNMIVGTWPISGTGATRMIATGTNALATYVVLVCRPRPADASRCTRSDLVRLLRAELAPAVTELQKANIAPVDLAQAVIGPGMQVYSRHRIVVETDGSRVGVADALSLINRTLAEILDEQEGDLDPDSRWAVTWYEEHGLGVARFGEADQLARAKGIAVDALVEAGIVSSGANRVSLIPRHQLAPNWDPSRDVRPTAWEAVQYMVRSLEEGGETAAADLYARLGPLADSTRELAYRLFQIAEKQARTDEAIAYNSLVASWSDIARLASDLPSQTTTTSTTEAMF